MRPAVVSASVVSGLDAIALSIADGTTEHSRDDLDDQTAPVVAPAATTPPAAAAPPTVTTPYRVDVLDPSGVRIEETKSAGDPQYSCVMSPPLPPAPARLGVGGDVGSGLRAGHPFRT